LVEREKIFEPLLKKMSKEYLLQRDAYYKIRDLTEGQIQIKSQKDINLFTDLAAQKESVFEEIALRNEYLNKARSDIMKSLQLEEFTISTLREKLNTQVIDELLAALVETGEAIKDLEKLERENEENLKRILKIS
jgi:ABC-type transporter lipoprotein component MlaA